MVSSYDIDAMRQAAAALGALAATHGRHFEDLAEHGQAGVFLDLSAAIFEFHHRWEKATEAHLETIGDLGAHLNTCAWSYETHDARTRDALTSQNTPAWNNPVTNDDIPVGDLYTGQDCFGSALGPGVPPRPVAPRSGRLDQRTFPTPDATPESLLPDSVHGPPVPSDS